MEIPFGLQCTKQSQSSWVYFKIVTLPIYFNNLHRLFFCIIPRNITSHYPQEQVDTLLKLINEIKCSLNK